ncbi:GSCFA domain-containing protein [Flavicella sp.]|uniref:GSCFA domain-containing protein n=1 Tax=Flavicella sp. TaxID=2957742 RepID=UPI00262DD1CD|nr:GSCFA domain-containing protein [Flavicella sp.]MDG1804147.1 GSCFA domain-containing protein [Flavicella sp.]MDG2279358.1 GSCFA domain-containing protein [Flavicella sp.]
MENSIFRTQYKINKELRSINYNSEIILFGSCFSENIGAKFDYFKFQSTTNPYGILFNPVAIEKAISECIEGKKYADKDLISHNDLWHSFNHHSDFSRSEKNEVLNKINTTITTTQKKLRSASHIIITLGTSWVYQSNETKEIVANCHKIPQREFSKKLLSVTEIEKSIKNIKDTIYNFNSDVHIIFTVSPVRHLKDGMIENTLSKSHLIAAIHNSLDTNTSYFPAYEIMMDDLRDYRFYKEDMLHPNQLAVDYIWENFKKTWIANETEKLQETIDNIQKSLAHKPFNPSSEQHKKFRNKLEKRILELKNNFNISF